MPLDSDGQDIVLTGRVNYGTLFRGSDLRSLGRLQQDLGYRQRPLRRAAERGVLEHRDAHRIRQHDAHRDVLLRLSAGRRRLPAGDVDADGNVVCNANPFGGSGWRYAPGQVNFSQVDYDRTRTGARARAAVRERRQNSEADASRRSTRSTKTRGSSAARTSAGRRARASALRCGRRQGDSQWRPITGAFAFGADGMLDSGVIGQPAERARFLRRHQRAATSTTARPCRDCRSSTANDACGDAACITGSNVSDEARIFDHEEQTRDFSFNVALGRHREPAHELRLPVHQGATRNNYDILVAANSVAQVDYSTDSHGTPRVALSPGPNVNYADGFLANPHNYWMQFIQDHWEHNDADEKAARADVEYDLGSGGWLNSLKAGVRFADREQKVRYSAYNWAPIAPAWGCNGPGFNVDNTTRGAVSGGLRQCRIRSMAIRRASGNRPASRITTTAACSPTARWCSSIAPRCATTTCTPKVSRIAT